jgi:hypothetical protein
VRSRGVTIPGSSWPSCASKASPRICSSTAQTIAPTSPARAIAAGEGLTLDHVDKSTLASVDAKDRPATVAANFLAQDGYGQEDIFDNGGERLARERRVSAAPVQFHGGGGETLRDFFYLPDRPFSARELALTFWGQFDPATLTAALPAADYLASVATKLTSTLGTRRLRLPRPWVEWL